MFFESWRDFWAMGGYGFYVWLSYGLSLGLIGVLIFQSYRSTHRVLAQVRHEQARQARLKTLQEQAHES